MTISSLFLSRTAPDQESVGTVAASCFSFLQIEKLSLTETVFKPGGCEVPVLGEAMGKFPARETPYEFAGIPTSDHGWCVFIPG